MSVDTPEIVSPEAPVRSRPRWGRVLAWAGLLILLVILYFGLRNAQRTSMQIGQTAPAFALTTFDGQQVNLAALKGKVVVVNFWASWCKPCEQEAADLEAAWRFYQPRGDVVFLGVDYVDTEPEAKAYLQKFGITFPNGPDLRTKISQSYRITGVPETYIIDRTGKLVNFKLSPFLSLSEIKSMIDPLINQ
ncbi:MAG TPA: TlpA disulfide reductase family protein [Anaerolineales bacterium]